MAPTRQGRTRHGARVEPTAKVCNRAVSDRAVGETMRTAVRAVLVPTAVAWAVTAVVAAAWVLLAGGPVVARLGAAAVIVGGLVMLNSGNALARLSPLGKSGYGTASGRVSREYLNGSETRDLTSLGLALLVGGPLVAIGGVLLSI